MLYINLAGGNNVVMQVLVMQGEVMSQWTLKLLWLMW